MSPGSAIAVPRPRYSPEQAALYAAERACDHWGRRWHRVDQVQAYVDELVNNEWFGDRWPVLEQVQVVRVRRRTSCAAFEHTRGRDAETGILGLATLDQFTVLHELGHLCTPQGSGHGALFAETELTLVRHEIGVQAFAEYSHALRATPEFRSIRAGVDA